VSVKLKDFEPFEQMPTLRAGDTFPVSLVKIGAVYGNVLVAYEAMERIIPVAGATVALGGKILGKTDAAGILKYQAPDKEGAFEIRKEDFLPDPAAAKAPARKAAQVMVRLVPREAPVYRVAAGCSSPAWGAILVAKVPPAGIASSAFSIRLLNTSWSCWTSASILSTCWLHSVTSAIFRRSNSGLKSARDSARHALVVLEQGKISQMANEEQRCRVLRRAGRQQAVLRQRVAQDLLEILDVWRFSGSIRVEAEIQRFAHVEIVICRMIR
jgi:hypothetical protein